MTGDERLAWKRVSRWEMARLIEMGAEVPLWMTDRRTRMADAMALGARAGYSVLAETRAQRLRLGWDEQANVRGSLTILTEMTGTSSG